MLGIAAVAIAAVAVLLVALILLGAFACSALGRRSAETLENFVLSKIPGYLIAKSIAVDFGGSERQVDLRPAPGFYANSRRTVMNIAS